MSENGPVPKTNPYWSGWATFAFGLAIAAAYVFIGVALGVIIGIVLVGLNPGLDTTQYMNLLTDREGFLVSLTNYAATIAGVGLIIVFIKARKRLSVTEYLGLQSIKVKIVFWVIGLTAVLLLISILVGEFFNIQSNGFDEHIYQTSIWPPLLWVALIICAPAFEETFFRGFLFEGFRRSRIGVVGTIFITALAWSSLHIQYGAYEIGSIFVLGIILGIVRYKSGSLWAPIIMHACWNLAATIQLALIVG